jgi:hypothetical protein
VIALVREILAAITAVIKKFIRTVKAIAGNLRRVRPRRRQIFEEYLGGWEVIRGASGKVVIVSTALNYAKGRWEFENFRGAWRLR